MGDDPYRSQWLRPWGRTASGCLWLAVVLALLAVSGYLWFTR